MLAERLQNTGMQALVTLVRKSHRPWKR